MGRLPIKAWASVAILTTALASTPAYAADGVGVCGTIRLAETAVAMLDNQPIVKLFANSATVLLLLVAAAARSHRGSSNQVIRSHRSSRNLGVMADAARLQCNPPVRCSREEPMFLVRVPGAAGAELYKTGGGSSIYLPALISVPQPAYSGRGADEIRASPTNAASRA